ncbi:MAG TPA: hypothetical protein VNW92_27965 [Polyangiaceae bacterium]|jgi:hypothetical protein|nr:hypothetical protein [Polyangiaceae bacterium]
MSTIPNQSKVMVVAVEHGGQWRFNLRPEAGVDLVMVVQLIGEEPLAFARRFLRKVVHIVDRGADVVSAALAVAPVFDIRHLEARCVITRTLLRAFRSGANSQLHLVEPSNSTPDCLSHLAAIAEGLAASAAAGSQIRVGCKLYRNSGDSTVRADC